MEKHSRERERRRIREESSDTNAVSSGLFLANENLLCLPLHPDTRAVESQIAAVNFAQLPPAWLSPIWVFTPPFSLYSLCRLPFCLFYSLSLLAALAISLWIHVLVFSLSHFRSTFNCVVFTKNVIARVVLDTTLACEYQWNYINHCNLGCSCPGNAHTPSVF